MKQVLFLCTGNYYRSRFAEIYFNWEAQRRQAKWRAVSRGLAIHAANTGPISGHTAAWMEVLGIAVDEYLRLPQGVSSDDFRQADHIVAVKRTEHHPLIERSFPEFLQRVEFWEVHDLDCSQSEVALPHLEREVLGLLERLEHQS